MAKVTGIPEVVANLKKYQFIKKEAIKIRLKKQAFKIELAAKEMCPFDTGRAAASISTNWAGSPTIEGKTGVQAKTDDGVKRPDGAKELVYAVGSNVKYVPPLEFGTSKMDARPFLYPAYFRYEGETLAAIAAIMKKDVKL